MPGSDVRRADVTPERHLGYKQPFVRLSINVCYGPFLPE
jgi:hypothetical protein